MKRNTIQRTLTLKALQKLKFHPTTDEIYEEVAAFCPSISKGTVYRNLNQLAESGEIQSVEIPGHASHFDYRQDAHYHAVCMECGRVFDVDMDYIPDMENKIRDRHGFEFTGYDLVFKGICPTCRENAVKKTGSVGNC